MNVLDMAVVIPSRGRAGSIGAKSLSLFPDATICIEDSEANDYSEFADRLLLHPPLSTLGAIRQWILDNVDNEIVVMPDDDVDRIWFLCGRANEELKVGRRSDIADIAAQIVENAAICAKGVGAGLFGFSQTADVKALSSWRPFSLAKWVGTVLGVVGREVRYDENLSLHDDLGYSLSHLLHHRIIWRDERFHFSSGSRYGNLGGNALFRTAERHQREISYLKRKWGKYVHFSRRAHKKRFGSFTASVRVKRAQNRSGFVL